jgi:hypothetical protein
MILLNYSIARISVWACYGGWLPEDADNPLWSPPQPTEKEVMEVLVAGEYRDVQYGWDT